MSSEDRLGRRSEPHEHGLLGRLHLEHSNLGASGYGPVPSTSQQARRPLCSDSARGQGCQGSSPSRVHPLTTCVQRPLSSRHSDSNHISNAHFLPWGSVKDLKVTCS